MKRITIDDFIRYSLLIWTNEAQRDFCLKRFDEKFGMRPKLLLGFNGYQSLNNDAFSNGSRNCTFSHVMAVRYAQMSNWPFVVIFEQDAWLLDDDIDRLKDFLENKIPDDIEICLLGFIRNSQVVKRPHSITDLSGNDEYNFLDIRKAMQSRTAFCGSHAYILFGQEGMKKRVDNLRLIGVADAHSFRQIVNGMYVRMPLFIQHNCNSERGKTLHRVDDFYVYEEEKRRDSVMMQKSKDKTIAFKTIDEFQNMTS